MRIIGGNHSGFHFEPPKNIPARPTTDVAKEGLFNILYNTFDFSALSILDLFGGTGSISYEFASRGCPTLRWSNWISAALPLLSKLPSVYNCPFKL